MFAQSSPISDSSESRLTAGPLPAEFWPAYESFFASRSESRPLPPRAGCEPIGVFDGATLIAAAGLYDTAGPFMLVECVAANPSAPIRARHAAIEALLREIGRVARERNKTLVGSTSYAGLAAVARRAGIWARPCTALVANAERIRGAA